MRARFFGPDASTGHVTERLLDEVDGFRSLAARHPRRGGRRARLRASTARGIELVVHTAAQPSHDWAASDPHTDFGVNAQRHAEPARGRARALPRRDASSSPRRTRSTATGRTSCRSRTAETRLELPEDHRWHGGIGTDMSIDTLHALAVRRLQGRRRPARAGVRALLRHADGLLPRRLPDRPAARRRAAARLPRLPHALHGDRRAVHGLRLRRQAGARQHPLPRRRARVRGVPPRAAAGGRLQPRRRARGQRLDARGDRAVRAHRRPRARLDAVRPGPHRRPPLVDLRPRRRSARDHPGLGADARDRGRRCARSTTPTSSAGRRRAREALGRHPRPQRGGLDRRDGARRSPPRSRREGDRRTRSSSSTTRSTDGTADVVGRLARGRRRRPLPALALPQRLRLRRARRARGVHRRRGGDRHGRRLRRPARTSSPTTACSTAGYDCAFGSRFMSGRPGHATTRASSWSSTGSSTSASGCSSATATTTRRTRSRPTGARSSSNVQPLLSQHFNLTVEIPLEGDRPRALLRGRADPLAQPRGRAPRSCASRRWAAATCSSC